MSSTTHQLHHQTFPTPSPPHLSKWFMLKSHTGGHLSPSRPAPPLHHLQSTAKPCGFSPPKSLPSLSTFTHLHCSACKPPFTLTWTTKTAFYLVSQFTEWSKSEREKQILYINTYTWNLENWFRGSYLQSRNRDTEIENKYTDPKRDGAWVGWIGIDIYILLILL